MTTLNPNSKRAKRCDELLFDYGTNDTAEDCLVDLLTDARHWCDENSMDYAKLDNRAYQHYLAEIADAERGSQ